MSRQLDFCYRLRCMPVSLVFVSFCDYCVCEIRRMFAVNFIMSGV